MTTIVKMQADLTVGAKQLKAIFLNEVHFYYALYIQGVDDRGPLKILSFFLTVVNICPIKITSRLCPVINLHKLVLYINFCYPLGITMPVSFIFAKASIFLMRFFLILTTSVSFDAIFLKTSS